MRLPSLTLLACLPPGRTAGARSSCSLPATGRRTAARRSMSRRCGCERTSWRRRRRRRPRTRRRVELPGLRGQHGSLAASTVPVSPLALTRSSCSACTCAAVGGRGSWCGTCGRASRSWRTTTPALAPPRLHHRLWPSPRRQRHRNESDGQPGVRALASSAVANRPSRLWTMRRTTCHPSSGAARAASLPWRPPWRGLVALLPLTTHRLPSAMPSDLSRAQLRRRHCRSTLRHASMRARPEAPRWSRMAAAEPSGE